MRTLEARLLGYENGVEVNYKKIAGKSTETKPTTGLCTGSEFLEIDTGKTWYFSEADSDFIDPTAEPVTPDAPTEPNENAGEAKVEVKTTTRKTTTK